ncbi:MAG: hypothetical protein ACHQAY_13340 [Hyphomicrobiales bacterium]
MSGGRKKHPPKKKHVNRPRLAVTKPMSEADRASKAQEEFEKAMVHLIEAERLSEWGMAPNACVHAAYYAMHHCACAAILAAGGVGRYLDAPKSHEHVIQHYGNLVAGEQGALGESGVVLNRARTDRMVADYDLVRGATNEDAVIDAAAARKFVQACMEKWGFHDKVTDDIDH